MMATIQRVLIILLFLCFHSVGKSIAAPSDSNLYEFSQIPKRVAVVIGNGNYTRLTPLKSPLNDAIEMGGRLRSLNFDVSVIVDLPTADQFINKELPALENKINPGDIVLVYFSGHGFSYGKFNYIAPTELPALVKLSDLSDHALAIETVQDLLSLRKPGLLILLLDSCRKVPLLQIDDPERGVMSPLEMVEIKQRRNDTNIFVGYATKYDSTASGSATLVPSLFTKHLLSQLRPDSREFSSLYKDVIADVWSDSNGAQFPGIGEWSASEFYLKPTDQVLENQRTAWLAALSSARRDPIARFSMRFATSQHAAAARKWLSDHTSEIQNFTQFSPLAVEAAWGSKSTVIAASSTGLGFKRSQEAAFTNIQGILDSKALGVVREDEPKRTWADEVLALGKQPELVALKDLKAMRSGKEKTQTIKIPFGTPMKVIGVQDLEERSAVLVAETTDYGNVVIPISPSSTGTKFTELGRPLAEIDLAPRADARDLVDVALLKAEIGSLKNAGKTITWVSTATAATANKNEFEGRQALLIHTLYELKKLGVDGTRVTSIGNADDYLLRGVRVRIFGF